MPPDSSTTAVSGPADPSRDVERVTWSNRPWYRTNVGLGVIGFDVGLTVFLALATAGVFDPLLPEFSVDTVGVPLWIYAFSLLGALGFVFTTLIDRFDCETERLLRNNMRIPAALPLGAGVYVLSEVILGTTAPDTVVAGLAFLTGLYVNTAYKRLGALARRLLPKSREEETGQNADSAHEAGSDSAAGSGGGSESTRTGDTDNRTEPSDER